MQREGTGAEIPGVSESGRLSQESLETKVAREQQRESLKSLPDCFFFSCFLGLHPWHMEVSRLRVESELQLPPYTTATAT